MTKIELFCLKGWNIWEYKGVKIKWIQNDR